MTEIFLNGIRILIELHNEGGKEFMIPRAWKVSGMKHGLGLLFWIFLDSDQMSLWKTRRLVTKCLEIHLSETCRIRDELPFNNTNEAFTFEKHPAFRIKLYEYRNYIVNPYSLSVLFMEYLGKIFSTAIKISSGIVIFKPRCSKSNRDHCCFSRKL